MKKPEIEIIKLTSQDVLTESDEFGDDTLFEPYEE